MSLKIERDPDEAIKKKVANILPKVLDFDPKKRPNFPEICKILESEKSFKDQLIKTKRKIRGIIKERDEFEEKLKKLFDEHNKCPGIHKDLKVSFL